jgi:hypothetical protein
MTSTELDNGPTSPQGYFMNSHVYDILKKMVQIVLPAFGVFYMSIGAAWGLPGTKQVSDTIIAVCTFIGVLLAVSSRSYNKSDAQYDGALDITQNEDGSKVYSLNLNDDTSILDSKKNVNFKVHNI